MRVETRINWLQSILMIGFFITVGWIGHMTFRNQFDKPVTVENLEMRAVRVKVNGLDVTIPARDKWEER